MGTSAFRPLTEAEQIFKSLVWDPMLRAGETWLEDEVPVLALPVIKQVDEAVLGLIADYIYNHLVLVVDITAIRLANAEHQAAYNSAFEKLSVIALEQGTTSDAFKQAQDDAMAALAKFTHMGP